MLYLTIAFFLISGLSSVLVFAALMRSAQITRQLEQQGMGSLGQRVQHYRNAARNGWPQRTARRSPLTTNTGVKR